MKVLHLTLKKQWFDMIASGEKKEEYREIKPFWFERLVFEHEKAFKYCTGYNYKDGLFLIEGICHTLSESKRSMVAMKPFDQITFTNGYAKDAPKITLECKGIEIRTGNPDWGAEPGKEYFVIKLGEIIH